MALSGSNIINMTSNGRVQSRVYWTATQDKNNNTSTITVKVYSYFAGEVNSTAARDVIVNIGGQTQSVSRVIGNHPNGVNKLVATVTKTVAHASDGKLTTNIKVTNPFYINYAGNNLTNGNHNFNITLDTIPRNSLLTAVSNASVPSGSPTFTIQAADSSFTHVVDFKMNNKTLFSRTDLKGGTHNFDLTTAEKNKIIAEIPNNTSATFTVVLGTYNNGVHTGTAQTRNATVSIDSSIVPTISAVNISEANSAVKNNFTVYVQDKSQIKVDVTRAAGQSATVKETRITIGSQVFPNATSATSAVITVSGSLVISVSVTDSRNRVTTTTQTITIIEYAPPIISRLSAVRTTNTGVPSDDSTIATVKFLYNASSVSGQNVVNFTLKYRKKGTTAWTNWTSGTGLTGDKTYTSSAIFNVDNAYDIELVVTDKLSSVPRIGALPTAFPILDFHESGKGVAFGKVADKDGLEVAMKAYFNDVVTDKNGVEIIGNAIVDTRDDNRPPRWYVDNYPRLIVREMKTTTAVGLPQGIIGGIGFCEVETRVRWGGNYLHDVTQTAYCDNNRQFVRVGKSTSWTEWMAIVKGVLS